jgi:hypothetical protein
MQGQQAMDVSRFIDANTHFEQAVEADPMFAFGSSPSCSRRVPGHGSPWRMSNPA